MQETVRIGCRLVNGARLRMFAPMLDADTGLSPIKFTGEEVVLGGTRGVMDTSRGPGCCETAVPRDFWERWKAANMDSPLLRNGMIFETEKNDT